VDIFTQVEAPASSTAPAGVGNPGWMAVDGTVDSYTYRGTGIPLRKVVLRQGKVLKVRGDDVGLALAAPLGAVAVRITTGSQRSCAIFDAGSVRRDDPGIFLARDAAAPAIADCSDATLLTAIGTTSCTAGGDWPTCGGTCPNDGVCAPNVFSQCVCAFPGDPCGGTAPVCNGECAAGEECVAIEDGFPGTGGACTCTPIGVTPCGAGADPACENACPSGKVCGSLYGTYGAFCACHDDGVPCGPGPGECSLDTVCTFFGPGYTWSCLPTFCGGTFPTCGGTCGDGRACVPLDLIGTGFCVCATPGFTCDGPACGEGFNCPSGEVCTVAPPPGGGAVTCSCQTP